MESAKMSGMVVFLIGVSNILGWVMAFTQIPQAISEALLGLTPVSYTHLDVYKRQQQGPAAEMLLGLDLRHIGAMLLETGERCV